MKIYHFEKKVVIGDLDGQAIRDYEKHYGDLQSVVVERNKIIECVNDPRQKDIKDIARFNKCKND